MFVAGYFMKALAQILGIVINVYIWIVIGRAVVSWVNPDPYNPIVRLLNELTEPVLGRMRRALPLAMSGIDLSPMLLILVLIFLQSFLVPTLERLAFTLG